MRSVSAARNTFYNLFRVGGKAMQNKFLVLLPFASLSVLCAIPRVFCANEIILLSSHFLELFLFIIFPLFGRFVLDFHRNNPP